MGAGTFASQLLSDEQNVAATAESARAAAEGARMRAEGNRTYSERTITLAIGERGNRAQSEVEYTASEIRKLLQAMFPHRRLVLSQFTFFNQVGVARPTGETFRRKRRCYRLADVLPIACVLQLKEEGIPLKNIEAVPALLQTHLQRIFKIGTGCRLTGYGSKISLSFPGEKAPLDPLESFLGCDPSASVGGSDTAEAEERAFCGLLWGFDVGLLAERLREVADALASGEELLAVQAA